MVSRGKLLALLVLVAQAVAAIVPAHVREADLLFVVNTAGNAITAVTQGIDRLPIDHVAIAHRIGGNGGPLYVIEAVPDRGVTLTPIDSLLSRTAGSVVAARVNVPLDTARTIARALHFVGRPYDDLFGTDDERIYCSELVQKSYVTPAGDAIFETIPMSFHDASGEITPFWRAHYAAHGLPVPEGAPGTNPAQLSRAPQVTIVQ